MKLTPQKIQYSSKHGVSIEWGRPDEVVIGADDLLMLLLCLQGYLTQPEMDKHFSAPEQEVIQKYCLQLGRKQTEIMERYARKASIRKMKAEFRHLLDWWKCCSEEGYKSVMTRLWGWQLTAKETLPLVDRLILGALEADLHHDLARIKYLICCHIGDPKMTAPLESTKAKVESKFGPLDWDMLEQEGIRRYEKSNPSEQG